MNRLGTLLAALPMLAAVALLALLLLISSDPDAAAKRRIDLGVRQSLELTQRIDELLPRALDDEQPWGDALRTLDAERSARLDIARNAVATAYPAAKTRLQQLRRGAQRAFNLIDLDLEAPLPSGELRESFAVLTTNAEVYGARLGQVLEAQERALRLQAQLTVDSRRLITALRAQGEDASAEVVAAAVTRALESRSAALVGGRSDLAPLGEALRADLADTSGAAVEPLADLLASMQMLPAAWAELADARAALATIPLARLLGEFRELAGADALYGLVTLNDARVLLNVYTGLLLLVLLYLGLRLHLSNRALNRSHDDLELRVVERTADLAQANDDLKESQVQLVQAEKMSSLGQLVAGVMHEVNTPLMFVQSNVESSAESVDDVVAQLQPVIELAAVLEQDNPDRERINALLRQIKGTLDADMLRESADELRELSRDSLDGLGQISELVQSLKDFSRLDRADEDLFDVREGLDKTLTITRNLLKYGVEVIKDFDDVPLIPCAPSQINQIFINLITNAVQAMDGKGKLRLTTRSAGDWVTVTIADEGCGIPAEHLDRIMDPFFTTKPVGQGTGLGLSIVARILREHGGHLEVHSEPGVGTEFVITLPVQRGTNEEAA